MQAVSQLPAPQFSGAKKPSNPDLWGVSAGTHAVLSKTIDGKEQGEVIIITDIRGHQGREVNGVKVTRAMDKQDQVDYISYQTTDGYHTTMLYGLDDGSQDSIRIRTLKNYVKDKDAEVFELQSIIRKLKETARSFSTSVRELLNTEGKAFKD